MATEVETVTVDFMSMITDMYYEADVELGRAHDRYERCAAEEKTGEAMEAATQALMCRARRDAMADLFKEAFGAELTAVGTSSE